MLEKLALVLLYCDPCWLLERRLEAHKVRGGEGSRRRSVPRFHNEHALLEVDLSRSSTRGACFSLFPYCLYDLSELLLVSSDGIDALELDLESCRTLSLLSDPFSFVAETSQLSLSRSPRFLHDAQNRLRLRRGEPV